MDVCGIATDYCVRATALDAADQGFATTVLLDLTAAVAPERLDTTLARPGDRRSAHPIPVVPATVGGLSPRGISATTDSSSCHVLHQARGGGVMSMSLAVLAGSVSTVVFIASYLPMLVKAARTRDLGSYSVGNLVLANVGNLVYSIYVLSLPAGPIWALHSFYTGEQLRDAGHVGRLPPASGPRRSVRRVEQPPDGGRRHGQERLPADGASARRC